MTRRVPALLLALCFCLSSFAGSREDDVSQDVLDQTRIEIAVVPDAISRELAASGPTVDELRNLNHEAHETLEGDEDDRPWLRKLFSWRTWKDKLNFQKTFTNAARWFSIRGGDVRTHEHVVNLAIMYTTSHLLETALGTAAASWAVDPTNAAHWMVKTAVSIAGGAIVIPGLDPICLTLGYTYFRFPHAMHFVMTPPRFVVVRIIGPVTKVMGLHALARWVGGLLMDSEEGAAFLKRTLEADTTGIYRWSLGDGRMDVTVLDVDGATPLAHLDLADVGNGRLELANVRLWPSSDGSFNRARPQKALAPFGYNVRSAVLEASDSLHANKRDGLAKRVYVTAIEDEGEAVVVRFRPPAIATRTQRRLRAWPYLREAAFACARLLGGGSMLMTPPPKRSNALSSR